MYSIEQLTVQVQSKKCEKLHEYEDLQESALMWKTYQFII